MGEFKYFHSNMVIDSNAVILTMFILFDVWQNKCSKMKIRVLYRMKIYFTFFIIVLWSLSVLLLPAETRVPAMRWQTRSITTTKQNQGEKKSSKVPKRQRQTFPVMSDNVGDGGTREGGGCGGERMGGGGFWRRPQQLCSLIIIKKHQFPSHSWAPTGHYFLCGVCNVKTSSSGSDNVSPLSQQ